MKVLICLASFIAVASASHLVAPAPLAAAVVPTGTSSQFRTQNSAGDYSFGYDEDHSTGGSFRRETGNYAGRTGSYGLRDIDGRSRIVDYVADAAGFRASIRTNEPGVEPKDPAATLINKAGPVAVAAPAPVALPAPVAAPAPLALPAPIAAPAPLALPAPVPYAPAPLALPAPGPIAAPAPVAYGGPVAVAGPAPYAAAPQAFSYNSIVSHLAGPVGLPLAAPAAAPYGLPAPAPLGYRGY